jgi:hypothetical protein
LDVVVRRAQQSDLAAIAALASSQQYINERHIAYLDWTHGASPKTSTASVNGRRVWNTAADAMYKLARSALPDIITEEEASGDLFARGVDYVHLSVREGNIDERPLSGVTARRSAAHGRHR